VSAAKAAGADDEQEEEDIADDGDNDGDDEAVAGDDNEQKMTEAQAAVVKRVQEIVASIVNAVDPTAKGLTSGVKSTNARAAIIAVVGARGPR
jgi:hypothetical protein